MSRLVNHISSFFPKLQSDFKITGDEVFSEVYKGDFYENIPFDKYINKNISVPTENIYSVLSFGALPNNANINNADAINSTILKCSENGGGIVLVEGGAFTTGTVFLKSNVAVLKLQADITSCHDRMSVIWGNLQFIRMIIWILPSFPTGLSMSI